MVIDFLLTYTSFIVEIKSKVLQIFIIIFVDSGLLSFNNKIIKL